MSITNDLWVYPAALCFGGLIWLTICAVVDMIQQAWKKRT